LSADAYYQLRKQNDDNNQLLAGEKITFVDDAFFQV